MRAVFLDYQTVSYDDLDTASLMSVMDDLHLYPTTLGAQIAERIQDAEIVLLNKARLSREVLQGAKSLRLIVVAGTGTDGIDVPAAQELGIGVCNVRAYCTASVAQHTWGLILSLTQQLPTYARIGAKGSWVMDERSHPKGGPIRELAGRTLGIVGWGELGRAVARIGQAFDMRIEIANRHREPAALGRVDLGQLLATADIVSLHCPLTPATRGMIGAVELALMKPDALLINTARGALIDSAALAAALKAGRLGGAGIDVLPQEPPIEDELLQPGIPNLLLTPHIAWSARESRQRCIDEMAANIQDFLRGGRRGRIV
jgi:glycerate dehydrogenase